MYYRNYILLLLIIIGSGLKAQDMGFTITGEFSELPFARFVTTFEAQNSRAKFLYDESVTENIFVTASFLGTPAAEALDLIFSGHDIYWYIDDSGYIILTKKYRIRGIGNAQIQDTNYIYSPGSKETAVLAVEDDFQIIEIGRKGGDIAGKVTVSGYIRTIQTGEPVIGAVFLVDEIKFATMTNQYGYYSLTLPHGVYNVQVSCLGMKSINRQINIYSSGTLDIDMVENLIPIGSVTVTADGNFNLRRTHVGLDKLDIKTVKIIPSNMGEADIIKTTLMLPGVQSVGEGASGFNVRGGSADQNLILLYDVPLFNPSHFFGFFSSVNPDVISDLSLYKGGIPAKYGGRISSVLQIVPKDGNKKAISGGGGISPVTTSLILEGPVVKDKTSFLIAGRTTYSNWVLKLLDDFLPGKSRISFYDTNLRVVHEIDSKNNLELSGYLSHDAFRFRNDTVYSYNNRIASIKWRHIFNNRLFAVFSANYSNYNYNISSENDRDFSFDLFHNVSYSELKAQGTYYPNYRHQIDFGIEAGIYRVIPGRLNPIGDSSLVVPTIIPEQRAISPALYINDEIRVGENLYLNAGVRLSSFFAVGPSEVLVYNPHFPKSSSSVTDTVNYGRGQVIRKYLNPELRLSLNFLTGPTSSVKLNYNNTTQYIHQISNTTSVSPTDIWLLSDNHLRPRRGQQIAVGFYSNLFGSKLEFSVEGYYKSISDMIDFKGGATLLLNRNIETDIVNTYGRAHGIELMLKKSKGRMNGWLSYTYSRIIVASDTPFAEEEINSGARFPANYDKPHDFTAIVNYIFSRRFSFSSVYTYSTGRPITYPIAAYNFAGTDVLHYSDRNKYRIPDYSRLDISFTLDGNLKSKKLAHSTFSFSVYNLLGRDNVYSIFFNTEHNIVHGYKLSVFANPIPSVSYSFKF
jgi:hypothetical protein